MAIKDFNFFDNKKKLILFTTTALKGPGWSLLVLSSRWHFKRIKHIIMLYPHFESKKQVLSELLLRWTSNYLVTFPNQHINFSQIWNNWNLPMTISIVYCTLPWIITRLEAMSFTALKSIFTIFIWCTFGKADLVIKVAVLGGLAIVHVT